MREGEEVWKSYAEEIKAGKKKSFLELMEERGLVNKVIGYVSWSLRLDEIGIYLCFQFLF